MIANPTVCIKNLTLHVPIKEKVTPKKIIFFCQPGHVFMTPFRLRDFVQMASSLLRLVFTSDGDGVGVIRELMT